VEDSRLSASHEVVLPRSCRGFLRASNRCAILACGETLSVVNASDLHINLLKAGLGEELAVGAFLECRPRYTNEQLHVLTECGRELNKELRWNQVYDHPAGGV
jgi:hypothetical protein